MIDITEILAHWYAGRSQYDVAGSLGVARGTIRRYVEPAIMAGFVPGGTPPMSQADWEPLVKQWFPHLTDTRLRQVTWPDFDKHREYIAEMLRAGVTKAAIHQRLRDEHQVTGSLASFKRYVAGNLAEDAVREKVTVLRADPEPGLEGQIDYGLLGSWTDPRTGRSQRIWAFVMVLSHSRHMFVRPVISMDQASWTASHVEAFAFFGGCPARLIPDNLKTGVDKPDLYDPKLNRAYAELAAHYGVLVDPARARKPKDKPRVERQMPYIRDSWWKGREFTSLVEMQASALHWCREVAGQRKHRSLDGRTPAEVFDHAEAGTLTPLPAAAFTLAEWSRAKVGTDVHVKSGKALYSVPWRLIGQLVDIRATATMVQIFHHGELVKTHVRKDKGKVTDVADYPPEKIAFHTRTPQWCHKRAEQTGPATAAVIAELLDGPALHRLRSAQAILNLAGKYSDARLETLDARLAQAQGGDLGYLEFLQILCDDEITRREQVAMGRRLRRARFDTETTLEGLDFGANSKLPAAQIRDLAALRWLQAGESIILYGAVGVGKTHVAQAMGHLAIRAGAEVRFHKTSRILADLAGGHADRTFDKRLAAHVKADLLILDDFAMREFTPGQADDLYELISQRIAEGRSNAITANRAPQDWYPLFPNPVIAESLLDRLINNSHQVFMNGPSYRPNKRPKASVTTK